MSQYLKISCLFIAILLIGISCKKDPGPSEPMEQEVDLTKAREDIAKNISNNFILPEFATLNELAKTFNASTTSFSAESNEANLLQLRNDLKALRIQWQHVAIFNIGPSFDHVLAGSINTYPLDQNKIESNISNADFIFGRLDNKDAEGFQAIAYLIHNENALDQLLGDPNRLDYLVNLTIHTTDLIDNVNQAWEGSSYLAGFISADQNGTDVGSAIGVLINAMDVYLQRFFRDGKVGIPAGVRSAGITRPTATEAHIAMYDKTLFLAALDQIERVLGGNNGNGSSGESLLSYLDKLGHQELSALIRNQISIINSDANAVNENFSLQIEEDNQKMIDLFLSIQDLVGLIKSDMATMMGIKITNLDVDGD